MEASDGLGVTKVDCLVSLVLSIGAQEQLRALSQLRDKITAVEENLGTRIHNVSVQMTGMQNCWIG